MSKIILNFQNFLLSIRAKYTVFTQFFGSFPLRLENLLNISKIMDPPTNFVEKYLNAVQNLLKKSRNRLNIHEEGDSRLIQASVESDIINPLEENRHSQLKTVTTSLVTQVFLCLIFF